MSYERGIAAFNLQMPDEIPHTQYITHPRWMEYVQKKLNRPNAGWAELLDFDYVWSVDGPSWNRGRWTDMGHAIFQADGSDYRLPKPSPFNDKLEDIYNLDPLEEYGPIDLKEQTEKYRAWCKNALKGDYVTSGGTYNSVVSFAIAAFGWENLLLAVGQDPDRFGEVLNRWTDYLMVFVQAWAKTEIEVYHTHDDMVWTEGSIFKPEFYRKYVFPNYKKMWDCAKDAGKKILFTSDGNYTEYVDDLVAAGAEGLIFEPLTNLEMICKKYGQTHVIIGNADCRILTFGTKEDVYNEVKRCIDLGRNCPGYFFAVGNHIPPNVPIENAEACMSAYFEMRKR
ncbi:MAG: uroporphyrinogen decarboxylase family protein [Candidatus Poribacteria bacterium]